MNTKKKKKKKKEEEPELVETEVLLRAQMRCV